MKVVKLDTPFRDNEWRKAFASRLIKLRPDMNPDAADEVSDSEFLRSSAFSPLVSAERYAEDDHGSATSGDSASGSSLLHERAPRQG